MRLLEIFEPVRTLTATKRFRETFRAFWKHHPEMIEVLREFCEFRLSHRSDEPYSIKDESFGGSPQLRGYRHFHMVFGKVILIYRLDHHELGLSLVMDHGYSSVNGRKHMVAYLNSPATTYEPMAVAPKPGPTLTSAEKTDIQDLLFDYAADDRDGLKSCLTDLTNLFDFTRLIITQPWPDPVKDQAVLDGFGGERQLLDIIRTILQQTAPVHAPP